MNRQDDFRRERLEEERDWDERRRQELRSEEENRFRRERGDTWSREGRQSGRGETERWEREREMRRREGGGWGREDDRERQSGWGGFRSARESDYPQGGYRRESWPYGGFGQQDYQRERHSQESGSSDWPYRREGEIRSSYGTAGTAREPERTSWGSTGFGRSGGQDFGQGGYGGYPIGYEPRYGGSQGGGYRESFFGRGPRNYQRSDERIREDVCERLTEHPGIDATDIDIVVTGREVTLEGAVEDREQKRMVEDMVEYGPGVKDVHNHLKARRGGGFFGALFGGRDRDRERDYRDPGQYVDRDRERRFASDAPGRAGTTGIAGEMGSGTATDRTSNIFEGMEVQGRDGQKVGRVKTLQGSDFVLDRPRKRDLVVPRAAVGSVTTTIVTLLQDADRIDDMGWQEAGMQESSRRS